MIRTRLPFQYTLFLDAYVLYEGGMRLSFYNLTANQREVDEKLVISQGFYFKESH